MSRRGERHLERMPLEEHVRVAMVDLFEQYCRVRVEAHDHADNQGLIVMVTLPEEGILCQEKLQRLLAKAGETKRRLVPLDHRLHQWMISVDQSGRHLASVAYWDS